MADLFAEFTRPVTRGESRRRYSIPLSILTHAAVIALLIVVPLVASDRLPIPRVVMGLTVQSPPPLPPSPARAASPVARLTGHVPVGTIPSEPPAKIAPEASVPAPSLSTIGGASGSPSGIDGGVDVTFAPPPEPPRPQAPDAPVRVGGNVTPPQRLRYVQPVYPQIAIAAKVSGIVTIDATIDPQGNVTDAVVLRSVQLLDTAALFAVRQWKYSPTLLNGTPVSVVLTVNVVFTLK